jgi:hypothetical protein|eukprot:2167757-Prymnesium_polylepis.1
MFLTEAEFVRKCFRKARNYQNALRHGATAFTMNKAVTSIKKERYVSHRRPAPSELRRCDFHFHFAEIILDLSLRVESVVLGRLSFWAVRSVHLSHLTFSHRGPCEANRTEL